MNSRDSEAHPFYAWDLTVRRANGLPDETVTYVARSEREARRKAMMRSRAVEVLDARGMTEEAYRRAHGSRRRRV